MQVRTGERGRSSGHEDPAPGGRHDLDAFADQLVRRNVHAIAELESAARQERSAAERVVDAVTAFSASLWFVIGALALLTTWVAFNLFAPAELRFDPFPFGILTLVASAAAIFLTAFILMTQNRLARLADRRHHLDLQISMLAEQEITKVLELLEAVHERLGIARPDPEIDALKQVTDPERIVEHIENDVEAPAQRGEGDRRR